jgi:hypothetical protein
MCDSQGKTLDQGCCTSSVFVSHLSVSGCNGGFVIYITVYCAAQVAQVSLVTQYGLLYGLSNFLVLKVTKVACLPTWHCSKATL